MNTQGVQATPRKRKAVDPPTPSSGSKSKRRAPSTPNPPLAPFPTPPATRHRKFELEPSSLSLAFSEESFLDVPAGRGVDLPTHLQTLLTLHRSFNLALSLHMATHPPVLPPHSPSTTRIPLPNLTNFLNIRETVERTSNRRFGIPELQRLAWVWTWDGTPLAEKKVEENPFLVSGSEEIPMRVSGMGFLITPTRTLDTNGRRVYTHGIGIELELKVGETRQVLHGGNEGGLGNKGQGGGMGALGRWSGNGEIREEEFLKKLEKWIEIHGGVEHQEKNQLPTPSTTTNQRSTIPPIPLLPLPHLPSSALLPSANLFTISSSSPSSGPSTPRKPPTVGPSGLADPFVLQPRSTPLSSTLDHLTEDPESSNATSKTKSTNSNSVEARRQAMAERIKARSRSSQSSLPPLGQSPGYSLKPISNVSSTQEELRRRSTLSRLESIAEGVWMLFSPSHSQSTNNSGLSPSRKRRAILLTEAAEIVVKSSKTPISLAEAQSSLTMLCELCPFFLTTKVIGRQDWLEMPSSTLCPPSPSNNLDRVVLNPPVTPPGSPSRSGGKKAELAGPASLGRVRRQGGLREVRERIRRELGE
ncbi:hypothetical protein TREMEDRAFT_73385 [Tremella mesenterica DSM 1558]|uniref:uncharacterized protein n=1 Tax=Tremella mesenterica (strain ATCC 24925 / CBS 8224 / DSM 1558 / NBRC 9311 / NRRL Y-6157 / RJB 2259-6 / UBC 559-6) TaxID=578456 RepID=UPI0003F4A449|nr:uncharacterized protein TREMEDRAFT_73385 [Tremella mesenterica DSM 1558]EIW71689.1 hypothetical protein TREMEDRAFT_73385 [Tremella mesenterica DSM 1558]